MNYQETMATLKGLFPGHDENSLTYALQKLDEQVKRARDFHKVGQERWFELGNSFKIVAEYMKWLEKQQVRGYSLGSLAEDFSTSSPLFDKFLKETGTDLY